MDFMVFNEKDFDVFKISDFAGRMSRIRGQIRPKLEALGIALGSPVSGIVERPVFAHVAKHARRTTNPPDDTWVAFCGDRRGYKKHAHFKVAISLNSLRFLFEIGPEFGDKRSWSRLWKQRGAHLLPRGEFTYFRTEHDEEAVGKLANLSKDKIAELARELTGKRSGQIVLGKRIAREVAIRWRARDYHREALKTFESFASLYRLY